MKHNTYLLALLILLFLCSGCKEVRQGPINETVSNDMNTTLPIQPETDSDPLTWTNPVSDRTYYRYQIEKAQWTEDTSIFPIEWRQAASSLVCSERQIETCAFSRGWLYDIDGDGKNEAIMLFRSYKAEDRPFMYGDSDFVFINSDGEAEHLTGGCDDSWEDWNRMEVQVLRYTHFNHVILRSGNETMTSSSWEIVYRLQGGTLNQLISNLWGYNVDSGVFLETFGPQGQGPGFFFWDSDLDRYSLVGPYEISPEAFIENFEANKINWAADHDMAIPKENIAPEIYPERYSSMQIEKVEVYGNRYYQLYFTNDISDKYNALSVAWLHRPNGTWELFWGPHPGLMNSPAFGVFGEENLVYDVDMDLAEKEAA